jgi:hypothetical protein
MPAYLVRFRLKREMARTMSDYCELINPQTMTATLLKNGEVVTQYKIERCDNCETLQRLDEFGYQKHLSGIKILWFCGACR